MADHGVGRDRVAHLWRDRLLRGSFLLDLQVDSLAALLHDILHGRGCLSLLALILLTRIVTQALCLVLAGGLVAANFIVR